MGMKTATETVHKTATYTASLRINGELSWLKFIGTLISGFSLGFAVATLMWKLK